MPGCKVIQVLTVVETSLQTGDCEHNLTESFPRDLYWLGHKYIHVFCVISVM